MVFWWALVAAFPFKSLHGLDPSLCNVLAFQATDTLLFYILYKMWHIPLPEGSLLFI